MQPQATANLLALTTMTCWGISNAFMKVPSLRLGSAKAIRFRQIIMFSILLIYKATIETLEIANPTWTLIAFLVGVFGYLPFYFFCEAIRIGSIGVINAIGNSFPVISAILTYLIFGTKISAGGILGIAITTAGIVLLSISRNKHQTTEIEAKTRHKAILFSIIACLCWGGFYTYIPIPNQHLDVITLTISLQLGTLLSSHLHSMYQNKRRNVTKKTLKFLLLAGIFAVVGSLCFYTALHIGSPGIVTAIAGSSPFVVAIFGHFVYHERISKQEILGILVAVFGVAMLSLTK